MQHRPPPHDRIYSKIKPGDRVYPTLVIGYTAYKLIRARIAKDLGVEAIYKRIR